MTNLNIQYKIGQLLFKGCEELGRNKLLDRRVEAFKPYLNKIYLKLTNDRRLYKIDNDGFSKEWEKEKSFLERDKKYYLLELEEKREKEKEEKKKEEQNKMLLDNLCGYADNKTALQRGNLLKRLNKKVYYTDWACHNNKIMYNSVHLKQAILFGYDVYTKKEGNKNIYIIYDTNPQNIRTNGEPYTFGYINKTEYDFCLYLKTKVNSLE